MYQGETYRREVRLTSKEKRKSMLLAVLTPQFALLPWTTLKSKLFNSGQTELRQKCESIDSVRPR